LLTTILLWLIGFIIVVIVLALLLRSSQPSQITKKGDQDDLEAGASIPTTGTGISNGPIAPPSETVNTGRIRDEMTYSDSDDLTEIEGIGPAMQEILYDAGINTYQKLSMADSQILKNLLSDAGLPNVDVNEWPRLAREIQADHATGDLGNH
jgi:predicted flap endonuclease-1-like 5' DNA nuclease